MLRAPRVSLLTLCPLAQPEKAIGHESQIEPWLALTTPLLDASETDERRYASKMNLENRKNRGSSHQYMGWMSERISLRLPVAGEVFFLDIPFYRTLLHCPQNLPQYQFARDTLFNRSPNSVPARLALSRQVFNQKGLVPLLTKNQFIHKLSRHQYQQPTWRYLHGMP